MLDLPITGSVSNSSISQPLGFPETTTKCLGRKPVQYGLIFGRGVYGRKAIGIVVSTHRVEVSGLNFHLLAAAATESRMFD